MSAHELSVPEFMARAERARAWALPGRERALENEVWGAVDPPISSSPPAPAWWRSSAHLTSLNGAIGLRSRMMVAV
jgi:hypothetical protein